MDKTEEANLGIKIGNPEEAFWNTRKLALEQQLRSMEDDLKTLPKLIEFQKDVIQVCDNKLKSAKGGFLKKVFKK